MADESLNSKPSRDHFANLVPRWSQVGAPLRPSSSEIATLQRVIDGMSTAPKVLVLGLTAEIIGCTWPRDTELTAVDHSPVMIQRLWPPMQVPPGARVLLADWGEMPIPSDTIDLVAGDGCFIVMSYPEDFERLTREVRRVLRSSGRFVIRVFLRPDRAESLAEVAAAFDRGEIGSVHALKLRLLAAQHAASGPGTRLDDVWQAWRTFTLQASFKERPGWTTDELAGIEAYQGQQTRYYLPTLAEVRKVVSSSLTEIECHWGDNELAERCPTLVFERRAHAGS